MARVDAQRTPVRRQPLHVKERQPMVTEDGAYRGEGKIAEVLVVDGIERVVAHQFQQVRELHRDETILAQQQLQSGDKIVEGGNVRQHVIAQQQVGLAEL